MSEFKRVSVIGLGYIGLPTAAMFASNQIEVVGVDVCKSTVDTINRGEIHIVEPGLEATVRSAVDCGYLYATHIPEPADAFLIAVPTPFVGEKHVPDLQYVEAAAYAIAGVLKKGDLVILESTSPVGTTEALATWLSECRPDLSFPQNAGEQSDIRVAHCPERVLPGKIMQELILNDRVIGGLTPACSARAAALYKIFVRGQCIISSSASIAEMSKLTENSFRDVNIAFANEISIICDRLDINAWELIALANRHPRVNILQPGPGVGGHCIAVDPWFIVSCVPEHARLIKAAREVNDSKPEWVLQKFRTTMGSYLMAKPSMKASDVCVAVYGLSFKPDIDDLRHSPALDIVRQLCEEHKGSLLVVEPNIKNIPKILDGAVLVTTEEARDLADIHLYLVGHSEFRGPKPISDYFIDTVGIFDNHPI